ncbi:MAG: hypothetical protein AAFW66_00880 [Pseudomonadota bacterium]
MKQRFVLKTIVTVILLTLSVGLSKAQVVNGDFSAGATGWTDVSPGTTDSNVFTGGNLTSTSNDIGPTTTGPNLQTFASQTFTAPDPGFLTYTLVSYTSTDITDFDFPIAVIDGTSFRIALDGSLVAGLPAVNNANQVTTPLSGETVLLGGSRTIGFGVQTTDSGFGPGIAVWDDIEFQEITQSPGAQSTLENNSLTLSGANAPQTATNTSATITVTLSVSNGIINLGSPGAVTITGGADGTATITFTGTPAQINTAMDGLVYTPNLAFDGAETLVFTASGGGATDTDNIAITVIDGTPSLQVIKTADDTTNVAVGQVITYTYRVINDGDQIINNVSLSDAHDGLGPAPVPANETLDVDTVPAGDSTDAASDGVWDVLAPGDEIVFTATYTITQNDIDLRQ